MAEYIDREEAKNLLELALEDDWEVRYAEDRLDEIPAADVAPVKRGKWIRDWLVARGDDVQWVFICSECGMFTYTTTLHEFCPHCGAKMYEEADNERTSCL